MTAEEIAAGLSERQRQAILHARWIGSGLQQMCVVDFTDPWAAPVAQFLTLRTDRLTPLGLAVRAAIIKGEQHD